MTSYLEWQWRKMVVRRDLDYEEVITDKRMTSLRLLFMKEVMKRESWFFFFQPLFWLLRL